MINKQALEIFEAAWLRRQIENHIIWGPLSRGGHKAFIFLMLPTFVFYIWFSELSWPPSKDIGGYVEIVYFSIVFFIICKFPSYPRVVILWGSVKVTMFFLTFIMFFVGGVIGLLRDQPDAIHVILLALIWVPGLEFIPKLVRKQKIISIAKTIVSAPIVYHMIRVTH